MQYANVFPWQICRFELMFRALYILEYACGTEYACMWSACGRLSVTMVILNKA